MEIGVKDPNLTPTNVHAPLKLCTKRAEVGMQFRLLKGLWRVWTYV
jgi:hypothetical protein